MISRSRRIVLPLVAVLALASSARAETVLFAPEPAASDTTERDDARQRTLFLGIPTLAIGVYLAMAAQRDGASDSASFPVTTPHTLGEGNSPVNTVFTPDGGVGSADRVAVRVVDDSKSAPSGPIYLRLPPAVPGGGIIEDETSVLIPPDTSKPPTTEIAPVATIPEPGEWATGSILGATLLIGIVRGRRKAS